MTYGETIDYLFNSLPVFQNIGGEAYKPGLERVEELLHLCGAPHRQLKTLHVAGTNGKGSTSHMLASILQHAGYRVGLFTSPHLVDFRERIRINGKMISEAAVTRFVEEIRPRIPEGLSPSFFELTTAMAFAYFAEEKVDLAVIEVGMGGRLDSTNVLHPLVSIITNVSIDHAAYLGETLEAIAREKAGIIKPHTPVVLGRSAEVEVIEAVRQQATACQAPLYIADQSDLLISVHDDGSHLRLETKEYSTVIQPLTGAHQIENSRTVLQTCTLLPSLGYPLTPESVQCGILRVQESGLKGRLEVYQEAHPRIIMDTGHNPGAWAHLAPILHKWSHEGLICLLGFAKDKETAPILSLLPPNGVYYIFSQAEGQRALPANELAALAHQHGLNESETQPDLYTAYLRGIELCQQREATRLFVGGSNFIIGELLGKIRASTH